MKNPSVFFLILTLVLATPILAAGIRYVYKTDFVVFEDEEIIPYSFSENADFLKEHGL